MIPLLEADPSARAGGELRVGIVEPISIDPALVPPYDEAGSLIVSTLCDPLIAFDPDTGEGLPALAKDWEVVAGGRATVVTLRDKLRFSNGAPFDSGDVVRSLSRVADPTLGSPNGALLGNVAGYEDLLRGEAEGDQLDGISVTDPYGFQIALGEPDSQFYAALGAPFTVPLPATIIGDSGPSDTLSRRPVCVGPYQMSEEWELGDSTIVLERSEAYEAGNPSMTRGGRGWVDRIIFRIYPTRGAAFDALLQGLVDVAPVPNAQVDAARRMEEIVVEQVPSSVLEYIGLPVTVPPFDLRAVRVAISRALDREEIVERVYGGSRVIARGFLPPTLSDHLYRDGSCGDNATAAADPSAARAALEEAGIDPQDVTAPLYYNDDFDNEALVEEVARQLRENLGLRLIPTRLEFTDHINKGKSAEGFDGPFRLSWGIPYPSPEEFLGPLFATSGIGVENFTRFSHPEFDEVLNDDAREATTVEDEIAAFDLLETILCEEMPAVPIVFGAREIAVRPEVVGSAVGRFTHRSWAQPLLRELYVAR